MAETICKSCEFVTLCRAGRDSLNGSKVKILGCSRYEKKPIKTNADRIRAMTDEELAEFLDRWELGDIDYAKTFCDLCNGQYDCHNDCLMDWLKQEATE